MGAIRDLTRSYFNACITSLTLLFLKSVIAAKANFSSGWQFLSGCGVRLLHFGQKKPLVTSIESKQSSQRKFSFACFLHDTQSGGKRILRRLLISSFADIPIIICYTCGKIKRNESR